MDDRTNDEKASLSQPNSIGDDGSTMEHAVMILASNQITGVWAEYKYISSIYGQRDRDWRLIRQFLTNIGGKYYDVLHIKINDGGEKSIWFDINSFFRK